MSAEEAALFLKQMRHLQEEIQRCELSCEEHEKNIKINTAKCINIEKETKDIKEYFDFEFVKKDKRLAEVREQLKKQKANAKQMFEELELENYKALKKLQDRLHDLNAKVPELEARFRNTREQLHQKIKSLKDQLALNQKVHDDAVLELEEEQLDPVYVDSILKKTEERLENKIKAEFQGLSSKQRSKNKMWRENLAFLVSNTPEVKEDWDLMVRQEIEFEESFLNMEQSVIETDTDNIILKQRVRVLRKKYKHLESQVKEQRFAVEDHCSNMESVRGCLRQKLAKLSASRSKLDKEISGLKASLQADSSRHTELKMAMKEADIMFKDILKEPQMDPQMLRRVQAILESAAALKTAGHHCKNI